jgi:hypothetical protein
LTTPILASAPCWSAAPSAHRCLQGWRPQQTAALIMCGTGYNPKKEFIPPRIEAYKEQGIGYRWG